MKLVIQRVLKASVTCGEELHSAIGSGLLILLGVHLEDDIKDIGWYVHKVMNMRIFSDEDGKMNLSVQDTGGELLIVSQFTLYGDARKGHRPGFSHAAPPDQAIRLYEEFIKMTKGAAGADRVKTGVFGAHMLIESVNDGPVTIIL